MWSPTEVPEWLGRRKQTNLYLRITFLLHEDMHIRTYIHIREELGKNDSELMS